MALAGWRPPIAGCLARRKVVLTEPRMRVMRGPVLEGQNRGVLDDAIADLDGPPDGLIRVPCGGTAEHGVQMWQEGLTDFPGRGVPQQRWTVIHGVVADVVAHGEHRVVKRGRPCPAEAHSRVAR